jgi:hypothetical protein
MKRLIHAVVASAAALACGCALAQADPMFRGPDVDSTGQAGVVFGSLVAVRSDEPVSRLTLWLRPLGDPAREFPVEGLKREPDAIEAGTRTWVFSGSLPAGRYEASRSEMCMSMTFRDFMRPLRQVRSPCFSSPGPRPVVIEVKPGEGTYVGRWLMSGKRLHDMESTSLVWMEGHVFLQDAFEADRATFEKKRSAQALPALGASVGNAVSPLVPPLAAKP